MQDKTYAGLFCFLFVGLDLDWYFVYGVCERCGVVGLELVMWLTETKV
jgi:hypothetical protein